MPKQSSYKSPSPRTISTGKVCVFVLCLVPALLLAWRFQADELGANPIEAITHGTGDWALRLLLVTLAITPLRKIAHMPWLVKFRRMLGIFAFFYALLHFITYIWLDQFFDWPAIAKDIVKRPFITVGFAAFVLLIPLAATSFNAAIRALGGKRWQTLHRAVYAIGVLGVLHYWWLVKRDITQPLIYAVCLSVLLGFRVAWRVQERRRQALVPKAENGGPRDKVQAIVPGVTR